MKSARTISDMRDDLDEVKNLMRMYASRNCDLEAMMAEMKKGMSIKFIIFFCVDHKSIMTSSLRRI